MSYNKGSIVKISQYIENENYINYMDIELKITRISRNTSDHPLYDDSVGQPLYDLCVASTGEAVPFCLYKYELQ